MMSGIYGVPHQPYAKVRKVVHQAARGMVRRQMSKVCNSPFIEPGIINISHILASVAGNRTKLTPSTAVGRTAHYEEVLNSDHGKTLMSRTYQAECHPIDYPIKHRFLVVLEDFYHSCHAGPCFPRLACISVHIQLPCSPKLTESEDLDIAENIVECSGRVPHVGEA